MPVNGPDASEPRERIMEATLEVSGRRGLRGVSVGDVLAAAGVSRAQFEGCFADVDAAFAAAYGEEAKWLLGRMVGSAASCDSWRQALHAALEQLATYVEERPARMRALLVEVHLAGEDALGQRREVLERLSRALDRGRREDSTLSPPPLTSLFMVGAIEAAIVSALGDGEPSAFRRSVPELEQLIADAYLQS